VLSAKLLFGAKLLSPEKINFNTPVWTATEILCRRKAIDLGSPVPLLKCFPRHFKKHGCWGQRILMTPRQLVGRCTSSQGGSASCAWLLLHEQQLLQTERMLCYCVKDSMCQRMLYPTPGTSPTPMAS
jgi:hypothetical protein